MHPPTALHMPRSKTWHAIASFLIAVSAYPISAIGQNNPKPSGTSTATSACPAAADMDHLHLQGVWRAELQDGSTALLQLGPHPELAQSVRGTVQRNGVTAQVSGDVDAGALTLEESINGTNISATWTGQVADGRCGKEIRGTWNNAHPTQAAPSSPFVLRKQAGW